MKRRESERGFTLIEAMIAMFILTISLLAVAQLMMVALDKTEFAKYETKAVHLAQAKVEELRSLFGRQVETGETADELVAGAHGPEAVQLPTPQGSLQGLLNFQVRWEVADLLGGQKAVSVTVTPLFPNPRQTETLSIATRFSP
jgi:prepilin-type N-terminal cleavage/methylation domain-containing protein